MPIVKNVLLKMIRYAHESILVCNQDGFIILSNTKATKKFGYTEEEFKKLNIKNLFFAKQIPDNITLNKTSVLSLEEMILYTKNSNAIFCKMSVVPVEGEDDSCFYCFYIKDQTLKKAYFEDIQKKINIAQNITKSSYVRNGEFAKAIHFILSECSKAIDVERINVWAIQDGFSKIVCIGNFDILNNKFNNAGELIRNDMPAYFDLIAEEEIIVTSKSQNDPKTKELQEKYLIPNNIKSMMDIPIRIEGEMKGILCFEKTKEYHEWTLEEQKFGLFIAQMISLALEINENFILNQKLSDCLANKK
jgi:PAS domain S-box-containing protein